MKYLTFISGKGHLNFSFKISGTKNECQQSYEDWLNKTRTSTDMVKDSSNDCETSIWNEDLGTVLSTLAEGKKVV